MRISLIILIAVATNTLAFAGNVPNSKKNSTPLVVVVNKDSKVNSLTKSQVIDIYMGRYRTFPNGEPVKPLDYAPKSDYKMDFYKKLVNRNEAKIDAYWARLLFSGRATPPKSISNLDNMLETLRTSINVLGYIPASEVDNTVKVVFSFDTIPL